MHPIHASKLGLRLTMVLVTSAGLATSAAQPGPPLDALRSALKFYASFDGSLAASHAGGDPALYWAPTLKQRQEAKPGLPPAGEVQHAIGAGRFGDALRFTSRKSPVVFFHGDRNVPYAAANWSGTVSFWLSTDPERQLEPGFCDPVQITPRAWNDAAFFVEFEKRPDGIPFRLGAYANLDVWNPTKRRFADIPAAERPLITVEKPPSRPANRRTCSSRSSTSTPARRAASCGSISTANRVGT